MKSHSKLLSKGLSRENKHFNRGELDGEKPGTEGPLEALAGLVEESRNLVSPVLLQHGADVVLCYFRGIKELGCPMLSAPTAEVEIVVSEGPS